MEKDDITLIILTKDEEKNIEDAIRSAWTIASRIVVVDSGSSDETVRIAESLGAEVFLHAWEGHAKQFNWALDHCGVITPWAFRLDADERISGELAEEIGALPDEPGVDGYEMRWRVYFMGKWIRHGGTHKPYFLRLFRYGKGRVENRLMDEHILVEGSVRRLRGDLIHYDYKGLDAWLIKHIGYSSLEIASQCSPESAEAGRAGQKRRRAAYYSLPPFLRARLYYWYRYYGQLGFLDGREGRIFAFLQAYWYRYLVDAKLYERDHQA